jgi:hypothetical protein
VLGDSVAWGLELADLFAAAIAEHCMRQGAGTGDD